jgi:hypothetical protein
MLIYSAMMEAGAGKAGQLAPMVGELRNVLTTDTGQDWLAWSVASGATFGSFLVSTRFDNLAALAAGQAKSAASEQFKALSQKYGDLMSRPAETYLNEVVATTGELAAAPKPLMVITGATMTAGKIRQALGWSTKIMQHVTDLTGVGGVVVTSVTGQMFQIGWMSGFDNPEHLDAFNGKMAADTEYLEIIDEAGDFFVSGSARRMIIAQLQ